MSFKIILELMVFSMHCISSFFLSLFLNEGHPLALWLQTCCFQAFPRRVNKTTTEENTFWSLWRKQIWGRTTFWNILFSHFQSVFCKCDSAWISVLYLGSFPNKINKLFTNHVNLLFFPFYCFQCFTKHGLWWKQDWNDFSQKL